MNVDDADDAPAIGTQVLQVWLGIASATVYCIGANATLLAIQHK